MYRQLQWRVLPALFFLAGANAWSAGPIFNILDYGAHNDASASATEPIRAAIQAAKAAGGGTVFVPAGSYVTGPIQLASNVTFDIDAGATLRFQATAQMPTWKGRMEGTDAITPVPLIGGANLENVAITGRGTVTTAQADWQKFSPIGSGRAMWTSIVQRLNLKQPVPEEDYQKAAPTLRPVFIAFTDSKNVRIDGIHILGAPFWTIHMIYSEKIIIRNVIIETVDTPGRDGIDIDSCRDVIISNCYLDTGDDDICLKSGRDADGLRVNRPTENVTITNCVVHRGHGAVAIGSETSGGIRNVVASNIVCKGTQKGVRIKSTRGRGGVMENLRFDNWTMEDVDEGINVTNYYTRVPEEPVSERTPVFRNIAISHMTIKNSPVTINIEGLPELPVEALRISDVIATGKVGLHAYNTVALELHNVQVDAASGPAFLIKDSKDLELDEVTTRRPVEGSPVVRLDRCPGAIVRNSRAFSGTGTFLSVAPGELSSIIQQGNTLTHAQKPTQEVAGDFWPPPPPPRERRPRGTSPVGGPAPSPANRN
ncbi:MAG TPA: glycoside hydrolase family 28 protein [Bryobacteraceae bacterium]|nr:glycoside hydrolase family 28 protein [Bryobacteraceae bacterium]